MRSLVFINPQKIPKDLQNQEQANELGKDIHLDIHQGDIWKNETHLFPFGL